MSHRGLVLVSKTQSRKWNYSAKALQGDGTARQFLMTRLNTLHDFFSSYISYICAYIYTSQKPCTDLRQGRDPLYMLHESSLKHHCSGIIAHADSSSPTRYLPTCLLTSRNRLVMKHNPVQRRASPGPYEAGCMLSSPPSI